MWKDLIINRILVVSTLALVLIRLKDILWLAPQLLDNIFRTRGGNSFEYNLGLSHLRNRIALLCSLPFALIADRFSLFSPDYFSYIPNTWSALAMLATVLIFAIMRRTMFLVIKKKSINPNYLAAVKRGPYGIFIVLTIIMLATVGVFCVTGASDITIRHSLYAELAIVYLYSLIRSFKILGLFYSGLAVFLYLCALELVPATFVVLSAIFL